MAEARRPPQAWYVAMAFSLCLLGMLGLMVLYLFFTGVGVWNLNRPVCWAFDITNFVFWVGIGHAGTLISAILFLFRQKWRTSINRFAEAMTIFAVMCAGLFPAIHVGRVWVIYWVFPYPNQMAHLAELPQPAAVGRVRREHLRHGLAALLVHGHGARPGHVPRPGDNRSSRYYAYGIFSLGWRGSNRHWHVYERAYLILAALATPLVLSVHSVVSFDFAVSQLPGWHTTIFPPYFVAGAIFSGFAMVVTLAVPARELFGLKNFITLRHLDNMAKVILLTSLHRRLRLRDGVLHRLVRRQLLGAVPLPQPPHRADVVGRLDDAHCNAIVPHVLWFKKVRTSVWTLFVVSLLINVGMWFERYVIIVVGLTRDFLPSSWGSYAPSYVEVLTLLGSFGLFLTLFLLFCRYLPMVAMAEVKGILPSATARDRARTCTRRRSWRSREAEDHGNHNPNTACRRTQAVGTAGRVPRCRRAEGRGRKGPRRRLPAMGLLHALPGPRARPGHGRAADDPALAGVGRGPDGLRRGDRLAVVLQFAADRQPGGGLALRLSAGFQRQALLEPAGEYPDHLRADGVALGADGLFRRVGPVAIAAALLPGLQEPAIPPGHRRRLLHHHRGPRSGLSPRTGAATVARHEFHRGGRGRGVGGGLQIENCKLQIEN